MTNWRNSIDINRYFTDEEDDQTAKSLCDKLIFQLDRIINIEKDNRLDELIEDLIEIRQDFQFIKEAIQIKHSSKDFDFDSWCDGFNEYLQKLYDLGDTTIMWKNERQKFLWVG
jgi:hypothetical protein